jgi:hypothetical protein
VLIGIALGAGIATATAYLSDLDADPGGRPTRRAGIVSTLANVGGLALGPLVAGLLASYAPSPLRLSYVVLGGALVVGLIAVLVSVEGHAPVQPRPVYHPQRFKAPAQGRCAFFAALTGAFMSFAVFGLIAGLVGTVLADSFHHTSPALTGLAIFLAFGTGAAAQTTTTSWPSTRVFAAGTGSAILGLAILVGSVWLEPPSLTLFLIGCVIAGAGCGGIFRGSIETVISTSTPDDRAGALATGHRGWSGDPVREPASNVAALRRRRRGGPHLCLSGPDPPPRSPNGAGRNGGVHPSPVPGLLNRIATPEDLERDVRVGLGDQEECSARCVGRQGPRPVAGTEDAGDSGRGQERPGHLRVGPPAVSRNLDHV